MEATLNNILNALNDKGTAWDKVAENGLITTFVLDGSDGVAIHVSPQQTVVTMGEDIAGSVAHHEVIDLADFFEQVRSTIEPF